MMKFLVAAGLGLAALAGPFVPGCRAQAEYAGIGPGDYVSVGATVSGFQSGEYGKTMIGGGSVYFDANLYRRVGMEGEVRQLSLHSDVGIRERTYLVGPKISFKRHAIRPYGKFLVGRGEFHFPYGYADGSYFVIAPGAGLDWRVHYSRLNVRLIDFEYQMWPDFVPYGSIHPYGVSAGISYTVFPWGRRER